MTRQTLGPVPDLERHLSEDWWRTIFNATYLRTDGDVVENPENTTREVDALVRAAGLTPEARVLDLCCGQGRHCLELALRGYKHVTGLDRSRYLIALARKRASAAGLSVNFHEGDARRFRVRSAPFDAVALMGNSFGYFDRPEDDHAVLQSVRRSLRAGGAVILDITDGEWIRQHFEPRSWEWIDRDSLVCRERALSANGARLVCREVVVNAAQGIVADQFYAQRLYDLERLTVLLESAGFDSIEEHGALLASSDRNQDLGMMEQRFFVTARVTGTRSVRRAEPATDVLVLLGDPARPDGIRPDGKFTVDDNDALRRLRMALSEVPGCAFRYHDDHATLLQILNSQRPSIVLNFCDEGFRNDLSAELHVPALLEVLGIPYTGAGPACLGLCVDKSHVRAIAMSLGVPVPREACLPPGASLDSVDVGYPAIVKPRSSDGSSGITASSVVHSARELSARVEALRAERPTETLLVQEFLPGTEYSVGLCGNADGGVDAFPVLEVDYSGLPRELPPILGYESKWNHPETPYWTDVHYREATLSAANREQLVSSARLLFQELGCRDYARIDFRTGSDGVIRLLEVNPNPGWGWGDELNYMAGWAGLSYPQLLGRIVDSARARMKGGR